MGFITLKNTALELDPNQLATWSGWSISAGVAYHSGCFGGAIKLIGIDVLPGVSYEVEYEVLEYTSGGVYPIVGGVSGINRLQTGVFSETISVPVDATDLSVKFYSDGELAIEYLNIYPTISIGEGAVTLGFNAKYNRWTSDYIIYPEMMVKFIDDLFSFKNGSLWKHNSNETRNLLHGVQSSSKIRFICNVDHKLNKLWYNLRLDSTGRWEAPEIITPPDDKFPNGMTSALKKNNFKSEDGKLWADLLRDMNDPNFATIEPAETRMLKALFEGRILQGCYISIELECSDTTEVKLVSAEVYYTHVNRTT